MQYLNAAEYAQYGLGEDTADALVVAASAMIDAFCRRESFDVTQYTERVRLRRGCEGQVCVLPLCAAVDGGSALVRVRARMGAAGCETPLAGALSAFGLAGQWTELELQSVTYTADGVVSVSPHVLGMPYVEVEITYTAGFAEIPVPVKVACAQIVKNAQAMPALNVKRQTIDKLQMEYFQGSLLDGEVQRLLQAFVAERLG